MTNLVRCHLGRNCSHHSLNLIYLLCMVKNPMEGICERQTSHKMYGFLIKVNFVKCKNPIHFIKNLHVNFSIFERPLIGDMNKYFFATANNGDANQNLLLFSYGGKNKTWLIQFLRKNMHKTDIIVSDLRIFDLLLGTYYMSKILSGLQCTFYMCSLLIQFETNQ